jgi:hypothetical protein
MWINLVCGLIFFLMVPGIVFTVPSQSKYITAAAHAVLFVIVHHFVNAYLKKHFGMEEPSLPVNKPTSTEKPVVKPLQQKESSQVAVTKELTKIQEAQLLENVPANF